jgi:hypothetical protein
MGDGILGRTSKEFETADPNCTVISPIVTWGPMNGYLLEGTNA